MPPEHRTTLRVALFGAVLGALLSAVTSRGLIDDTYITLSYARNLAEHGHWGMTPGLTSNAATSPLNVALLAGCLLLVHPFAGADGELALGVLTTLLGALAGWWSARAAARLGLGAAWPAAALVVVLANPFLVSALGLEVVLLFTAMTGLLAAGLAGRPVLYGLVAGAALLARLDMVVFVVVLALACRGVLRRLPVAVLACVAVCVPWFAVSWWWLGSAIPDTFVIKTNQRNFGEGRTYLRGLWTHYAINTPLTVAVSVVGAALGLLVGILLVVVLLRRRAPRGTGGLLGLGVGGVGYFVVYSVLGVPPYQWYYVPPMASLSFVAVLGAGVLASGGAPRGGRGSRPPARWRWRRWPGWSSACTPAARSAALALPAGVRELRHARRSTGGSARRSPAGGGPAGRLPGGDRHAGLQLRLRDRRPVLRPRVPAGGHRGPRAGVRAAAAPAAGAQLRPPRTPRRPGPPRSSCAGPTPAPTRPRGSAPGPPRRGRGSTAACSCCCGGEPGPGAARPRRRSRCAAGPTRVPRGGARSSTRNDQLVALRADGVLDAAPRRARPGPPWTEPVLNEAWRSHPTGRSDDSTAGVDAALLHFAGAGDQPVLVVSRPRDPAPVEAARVRWANTAAADLFGVAADHLVDLAATRLLRPREGAGPRAAPAGAAHPLRRPGRHRRRGAAAHRGRRLARARGRGGRSGSGCSPSRCPRTNGRRPRCAPPRTASPPWPRAPPSRPSSPTSGPGSPGSTTPSPSSSACPPRSSAAPRGSPTSSTTSAAASWRPSPGSSPASASPSTPGCATPPGRSAGSRSGWPPAAPPATARGSSAPSRTSPTAWPASTGWPTRPSTTC